MKRLAIFLLLAVLAGAFGVEGWQLRHDYNELREAAADLQQSEQMLSTPATWSDATISQAEALRQAAGALLEEAQGRLEQDAGLKAARALPISSTQTQALDDLVPAGIDGVAADADLVSVARTYIQQARGSSIGGRLLGVVALTAAPLTDADTHLRAAATRLQRDRDAALAPPLAHEVTAASDRVQGLLPKVDAAATLAEVLPAAMGMTGPRTYLIALPNPAELRPTGGLSAFVGLIKFDKGKAISLVMNRDAVYTPTHPCFQIPTVLAYYIKFQPNCLDLGDAGWDADFPTTARLMESMFKAKTAIEVDGVMAPDTYAISGLLRVLGPLSVARYGTFTADNLLDRLETIVNVQLDYGVVSALATSLFTNLLNAPLTRWPDLVNALQSATAERHLQLHMLDAGLEARLETGTAGGGIAGASGEDYLMVVDANVSPSKADVEITKSASLTATIGADGVRHDQVSASYFYPNPATPSAADKILNTDNVYRDYVRFYVPAGASLTGIQYYLDGHPAAAAPQPPEEVHSRLAIGVFFALPRGHSGEVRVAYSEQPEQHSAYRLELQKQAGLLDRPTSVVIDRPGGRDRFSSELAEDARFADSW